MISTVVYDGFSDSVVGNISELVGDIPSRRGCKNKRSILVKLHCSMAGQTHEFGFQLISVHIPIVGQDAEGGGRCTVGSTEYSMYRQVC